jgi:hypothetical protein
VGIVNQQGGHAGALNRLSEQITEAESRWKKPFPEASAALPCVPGCAFVIIAWPTVFNSDV